MSALVVAHHSDGEVTPATRELISAGQLTGPVTVALIARTLATLADQVDVPGVAEIVTVEVAQDAFEPDVYLDVVAALVQERRPAATLVPFSVDGIGYGPGVAARLSLGFAADVHGLALEGSQFLATRSFYGGRIHAELEFPDTAAPVLLLRSGVWAPAEGQGNAGRSTFSAPPRLSRVRHLEFVAPEVASDIDLTEASFLLAIGRAVRDADGVAQFEHLAEQIGATLAASRPLVDLGLISRARQVGQSGKIVKPKVYLAFGISGAVQHLVGIRGAETVIAVNVDPEAPIFEVADYGAVADVFDVADQLARVW
jgi:electron transfer flavoprotein alpha subunit